MPDSIVSTDSFSSYNALDVSAFHHVRINHSELFADVRNHINGVAVGVLVSKIRGAALSWVRLFSFRDATEDSK